MAYLPLLRLRRLAPYRHHKRENLQIEIELPRRAQENRKTSRRFFFFSRRKWAGGRRILQGGGAAVSPASACGAQASPAARYPTPSGRALGLLLRCRQWRCGQGLRSLCLAEWLRVPMPHGCTELPLGRAGSAVTAGRKGSGPSCQSGHALFMQLEQTCAKLCANCARGWRLEHRCATS